ncbi:MAG: hypothetical protein AAFU85_10830 [Planctomycetota bacterium]
MRALQSVRAPLGWPRLLVLMTGILASANQEIAAQQPAQYGLESATRLGNKARPYAPDFFGSLDKLTRFGMAISKDGRECYFAVALNDGGGFREEIRVTRRKGDGSWAKPQPLLPNEKKYKYVDPHFSPDEQRLFFIYTKPADESDPPKQQRFDIWFVERETGGWSSPVNVGAPISTIDAEEYFVSLTAEGKIFFGSNRADRDNFDLYSASPGNEGRYDKPRPLRGDVNTVKYEADVFVARDESFLIFSSSGRKDGRGRGDLYVSFKDTSGNWGAGINLGDRVNSNRQEFAPSISRDGKALFFSRGGVIHWVSTSVIKELRP